MTKKKKPESKKGRVGRPPRKYPEPLGQTKLYKADLRHLLDLARWRKDRLDAEHYAVADVVRDVFRDVLRQERDAENARTAGASPDATSPPATTPRPPAPTEPAQIPIYGVVAAGDPLHTEQEPDEWFDFREQFCREGHYMLRVRGTSMIGEHILPGDRIVIREQPEAQSGEDVVAMVDGQLTLKRLLRRTREVRLLPRNKELTTQITLDPARGDQVLGVLVGVVRKK